MERENNKRTYEYKLLIPKERVGALIGDKGKIKRLIEKKTRTKIKIQAEEITITGKESIDAWNCEQIIKAIGRGFNPMQALKLTNEDYTFTIIDIMDFARNDNDKVRLKGRVIGEKGKTRKYIENSTECTINVYGKTVGIIGPSTKIRLAVEAIQMLLNGAQTSTAYMFLDKSLKKKQQLI